MRHTALLFLVCLLVGCGGSAAVAPPPPTLEAFCELLDSVDSLDPNQNADKIELQLLAAAEMAEALVDEVGVGPLLDSMYRLAIHYAFQEQPEEAEPLLELVIEMASELDGTSPTLLAELSRDLGLTKNALGKHGEAEALLAPALDVFRADPATDAAVVLFTLEQLAHARHAQEKHTATQATLQQLLSLYRQQSQPDFSAIARVQCVMSEVCRSLGEAQQAEQSILDAVQLAQSGRIDAQSAQFVYEAAIQYSQATDDQRGVEFFRAKLNSSQTASPQAGEAYSIDAPPQATPPELPPEHYDPETMSESKREAYEQMLAAEETYLELRKLCDADWERFRIQRNTSERAAGPMGAMGVYIGHFDPIPPDENLGIQCHMAEQEYLEAKRFFENTP